MMPDEFEALKMWAAEEGEVRPELDLPTLAGTSKDLNFKRSMRQYYHAPLLRFLMLAIRFLMLATAGSAEGRCFPLRAPVRGKSNAG
jgi:hypothetical protein